MKSDEDLILDIETYFKRSRDHSDKWRGEAREDYDFVAGNQWAQDDIDVLREQSRVPVTFNRVEPTIAAVAGAEVTNRQEVRYIPRETGDAKVNEILTAGAKWVRDECNAEDEESDAFLDAVICGMGATETSVSYAEDPDGKIHIDRVDPIEMYWDPSAKKHNLADTRWVARLRRWSRDALVEKWGEKKIDGVIASLEKTEWDLDNQDDQQGDPHDASNAWRYTNDAAGALSRIPAFSVIEYQWFEFETVYRIPNPQTGQLEDVPPEAFKKLKPMLEASGIPFTDVKRRRAYRAFALGKNILESGPGPGDDRFTYTFITAKRDRNRGYWHGMVRAMKDPQRWANKFFSQILHIINSNSKGGLLIEQGAAQDMNQVKEEWARPDGVVVLNPGGLARVREKAQAQYPTGLDRLMEIAVSAIRDVTGVNLEMLGLADRTQAGVLEYQRKQAGLTILASLFDALRRYRKDQGRLLLTFIQKYVADGRLIRVVGDQGAQYVPLALDKQGARYDVVVDDSPTSPNQKEQVFGIMSQLMPLLAKMGVSPPPETLDYLPLPSSLIEKWKQQIQQQSQQPDPAMQAQQMEMQMAQQKAAMEAQIKETESDHAMKIDTQQAMHEASLEQFKVESHLALEARTGALEMRMNQQRMNQEAMLAQQAAESQMRLEAQAAENKARGDALETMIKMALMAKKASRPARTVNK